MQFDSELNLKWLRDHPSHYLHMCWTRMHGSSSLFAQTSCEVTAAAIRAHLTPDEPDWVEEQEGVADVCQIVFNNSGEWSDIDHTGIKINDLFYESYFNKYPLRVMPWTEVNLQAYPCMVVLVPTVK